MTSPGRGAGVSLIGGLLLAILKQKIAAKSIPGLPLGAEICRRFRFETVVLADCGLHSGSPVEVSYEG
jgi:hypothetical protein